jgi:hypothetical protein
MNGVFNQEECLFKFETSKQHSKRSKQSSKGPNTVINNGHPSPQDLNAGSSATTPTTLPPPRFGTVKLSSGKRAFGRPAACRHEEILISVLLMISCTTKRTQAHESYGGGARESRGLRFCMPRRVAVGCSVSLVNVCPFISPPKKKG